MFILVLLCMHFLNSGYLNKRLCSHSTEKLLFARCGFWVLSLLFWLFLKITLEDTEDRSKLYLFQANASCHRFIFVPVFPTFLAEIILVYLKCRDHQYSRLVVTVLKCISAGQSGHAFVIRIWPWDSKIVLITLVLIIYSLLSKAKGAGDENLGDWRFPNLLSSSLISLHSSFLETSSAEQTSVVGNADRRLMKKPLSDINLSKPHCHSFLALYLQREPRGHLQVGCCSARGFGDLHCFSPERWPFGDDCASFYAMYTGPVVY